MPERPFGCFAQLVPDPFSAVQVLRAGEGSPAAHKIDLLTTVTHELGHILGMEDVDPMDHVHELMAAKLEPGVRRMPPVAVDSLTPSDS